MWPYPLQYTRAFLAYVRRFALCAKPRCLSHGRRLRGGGRRSWLRFRLLGRREIDAVGLVKRRLLCGFVVVVCLAIRRHPDLPRQDLPTKYAAKRNIQSQGTGVNHPGGCTFDSAARRESCVKVARLKHTLRKQNPNTHTHSPQHYLMARHRFVKKERTNKTANCDCIGQYHP